MPFHAYFSRFATAFTLTLSLAGIAARAQAVPDLGFTGAATPLIVAENAGSVTLPLSIRNANATSGIGFDPKDIQTSIYECMVDGTRARDAVLTSPDITHLHLLPSHIDLVGAELEMINLPGREEKMKEALADVRDLYDFIIIDCSPSLGLITVNALTAADAVLIPVQCEYFALEGLGKLLNTIKIIQSRLNPNLEIEGILLTMYDVRLRLSNQVVEEVRMHFQQLVFRTIIPRNVKLSESPSYGLPVLLHDAESKGAISYLNLAREIGEKNGMLEGEKSAVVAEALEDEEAGEEAVDIDAPLPAMSATTTAAPTGSGGTPPPRALAA